MFVWSFLLAMKYFLSYRICCDRPTSNKNLRTGKKWWGEFSRAVCIFCLLLFVEVTSESNARNSFTFPFYAWVTVLINRARLFVWKTVAIGTFEVRNEKAFHGQALTKKKFDSLCSCFKKAKKKKRDLLFFFENGDDDKNDNHISSGSKQITTWSESTRCHGHTIFENEAMIKISRPTSYSKIFSKVIDDNRSTHMISSFPFFILPCNMNT